MSRTAGSNGPRTLEAIRKAGLRLICEHGYEAMSLRQLASEVGIQSGSLYNHITTKQALLFELIQEHMLQLIEQLDLALANVTGPVNRLKAFVAFHVTYHMMKKKEVFVGNFELRSLERQNYDVIVELRTSYERRLADILENGAGEGVFVVADVQIATWAILATLTGVCTWYQPGGRLSKEEIVAIHERLVLGGVSAPAMVRATRTARRRTQAIAAE